MPTAVTTDIRERIVDAATSIAAQAGFTKATTKEIAKKAKCSEGIIYHYFKNKRELFLAVIKENAEEFLGQLRIQIKEGGSAEDKMKRLIDFHFRYFTGKLHIFQILFGKSGDATIPFKYVLRVIILPYQQFIEDIIKQGIGSGEFQQVNAVIAASSLLGMMQFNIIKVHFGVDDTAVKDIKNSVKHLVFKMFLKTGREA